MQSACCSPEAARQPQVARRFLSSHEERLQATTLGEKTSCQPVGLALCIRFALGNWVPRVQKRQDLLAQRPEHLPGALEMGNALPPKESTCRFKPEASSTPICMALL